MESGSAVVSAEPPVGGGFGRVALANGTQYVYRIRAEKDNVKGGESNAVTVMID